jgi:hypothetical protein
MKYTVELKYINPSHEHVSLRRRVDTITRLVEASSEQEAINRAANQQRALGFMIKEASVVKPEVIKEEAEQVDEASNKYEVTKTKSRKMPMEFDSEAKMHHYDVHHNDKRVGTLTHDTYFGETNGKLHGKDLPNIRNYGDNPHNQLHNFLKSKTGQKWAANLHKYQKEEVEQVDEELDQLSGRFLVSTDPSKQRYLSTERGKKNAAKKNVANLKYYIKHSLGKHPKPNLPEEADQDMSEAKYFKTAYGYAGGSKPSGGTYKHPERIKADKEKEKKEKQNVTEAEREAGYKMSPAVKAAQAKSDALSKVKKPAQAGTLAAKKQNMEEEKANVNASKVKLRTLKDKISNRLKTVNMNPTIDSGKL